MTHSFTPEVKVLAKKYRSINQDFIELEDALLENSFLERIWVTMSIKYVWLSNKGKGKRGVSQCFSFKINENYNRTYMLSSTYLEN